MPETENGTQTQPIDTALLASLTAVVTTIYPMVESKTWIVNRMAAAQQMVIGTGLNVSNISSFDMLDVPDNYALDVWGESRFLFDMTINGDVYVNETLHANNMSVNNASIDTLYVNYLNTYITDLYINENLYVNNNVSINGDLFNFSVTTLNYLNVSNDTYFHTDVYINGSTYLDGITNINSSTYLNGIVYLNNNLFNTSNTIFCTSNDIPTYHNYEQVTLLDIDGLGYIDNLISYNISSTIISSSLFTSISSNLGCSITNVLNFSVKNNENISARVNIGEINKPVKFDLIAEEDNSGIIYTGQLSVNPGFTTNSIEINGINSSVNINGNININTNLLNTNTFSLYGTGQIKYSGTTYLNSLDVGYNASAKFFQQIDSKYILNVSGNTNITNDLTIGGNITHFSDYRLKTNLIKLENSLNKINNINGYTYNRIDYNTSKRYTGLIAQEVEKEYPDIVEYTNDIRSINYQSFTAILIESIKELNNKVSELEKIINTINNK
jgi:hypothetical protein